ncbi:MAG: fibronectin type III domain-containing protein, partial [Acidobacteria bacterium]|nr:fibronectin type III domain-containing protein [Acidobacteriota bacterium]
MLATLVTLPVANAAQGAAGEGRAWGVATFESVGVYYNRAAAGECVVKYRAVEAGEWRDGYPLVYDPREKQYRGSLVGLKPDTEYEVRLEAGGERVEFRT